MRANLNDNSGDGNSFDHFDAMRHAMLDCIAFGMTAEMLGPIMRRAECADHAAIMLMLARDGFEMEFISGASARAARRISEATRGEVMERDGRKCVCCGTTDGPFHLDHVQPVVAGGKATADNLVVACAPCNLSKGSKPLRQWRRK